MNGVDKPKTQNFCEDNFKPLMSIQPKSCLHLEGNSKPLDLHPIVGVAALLGTVALFDSFNKRTITSLFHESKEHPVKSALALGTVAVFAAHLVNAPHPAIDPVLWPQRIYERIRAK